MNLPLSFWLKILLISTAELISVAVFLDKPLLSIFMLMYITNAFRNMILVKSFHYLWFLLTITCYWLSTYNHKMLNIDVFRLIRNKPPKSNPKPEALVSFLVKHLRKNIVSASIEMDCDLILFKLLFQRSREVFWNTLPSWFLGSLFGGKKQNTLQPQKTHPQNYSRIREKQNSAFQ